MLTTDLLILLTVRDIELIDSPLRSRHTIQSSHSSPRLISRRQIDKTITLPRSGSINIAMHRQHPLTDSLQLKPLEQILHLGVDERLAKNFRQAAYEQPPALFDRFAPVFARVFPLVPVEDEGIHRRGLEFEGLHFAVLHVGLDVAASGAVAFACVVVYSDRAAADGVGLGSLDDGFGGLGAG